MRVGGCRCTTNQFEVVPVLYNPRQYDRRRTTGPAPNSLREPREPIRGRPQVTALKTAIRAERGAFLLKRALQQLVVENLEHVNEGKSLPEVRRGGSVVDLGPLLRPKARHEEP